METMYTTIFVLITLAVITYFLGVAVKGIATGNVKPTYKFLKWSPVIMFVLAALLIIALALDGVLFSDTITNYF
jgi:hypothetical protein